MITEDEVSIENNKENIEPQELSKEETNSENNLNQNEEKI